MCRRCHPKFEVQVDGKTVGAVDWWKATFDKHFSLKEELVELGRSLFIPGKTITQIPIKLVECKKDCKP